jgi:methionyl aminopeptidase
MYKPNTIQKHKSDEIIKIYDNTTTTSKVNDLRKAADCHIRVREYLQSYLKPNMKLLDICNLIENKTKEILGDSLEAGIGFPTVISLNNVAAHDGAVVNDQRLFKFNDVCKIDFGTHVNGNIIDSAFTCIFNQKYNDLLACTYDATWTGIKSSGVDARIYEISRDIEEVLDSYTIQLDNKLIELKALQNLGGHDIKPYQIHGGVFIPCSESNVSNRQERMQAGKTYAIETFASTYSRKCYEDTKMETSHFMLNKLKVPIYNNLHRFIKHERHTLPFSSRWAFEKVGNLYKNELNNLIQEKIIKAYPPLIDINPDALTSQYEHTIYIHEFGKEILSHGHDY